MTVKVEYSDLVCLKVNNIYAAIFQPILQPSYSLILHYYFQVGVCTKTHDFSYIHFAVRLNVICKMRRITPVDYTDYLQSHPI